MVDPYGLAGLILFYVLILGVGLFAAYSARRTEEVVTAEVFMTSGRNIGLWVGILTMTATWVGGGYINGTAEAAFRKDLGVVWAQPTVGYSVSLIMGGLFFAKQVREREYVTMLDPFQEKYGARVGGLMFLPALCGEIFWSAATLSALGGALEMILKLDMTVSIIVSASFAVMYTLFGGQRSVAYTDVAQLIFLTFGMILCVPFIWYNEHVDMNKSMQLSDLVGTVRNDQIVGYIDGQLLLIGGGLPWQVYFQRVLSSKDPSTARKMSFFGAAGCLLSAVPPMIIGIMARNADWDAVGLNQSYIEDHASLVLPATIEYFTPRVVTLFGLGAVSAAVMSSVDASVLSVASMFTHNIYKSIIKPQASSLELVWVLRCTVLVAGATATILGITVNSIYGLFYLCGDIVYVVLFPQLVLVMYYSGCNSYGAVSGLCVSVLLRLLTGESMMSLPAVISYSENVPIKTIIMLTNFVITILASKLCSRRAKKNSSIKPLSEKEKNAAEMDEQLDMVKF